MKNFTVPSVFLVGLLISPSAQASLSLIGGGTMVKTIVTTSGVSRSNDAKLGIGGGLFYEARLGRTVGLELGALYVKRKWGTDTASAYVTMIEAPIVFRFWFGKAFSLGIGGYMSYGMGDIISETSTGTTTTTSYEAAGYKKMDYGIVASMGTHLPLSNSVGLVFDGRYVYGLANGNDTATSSTITLQYSGIELFAGLRFGHNVGK